jgi:hypothetical protein
LRIGLIHKGEIMKVRMTKVYRDPALEGGLRTESVEGNLSYDYNIGSSIHMLSEPLDKAMDARLVTTSRIVKLEPENGVDVITTENGSVYRIEKLG